ncbi:type IV secretory system conjugative DNA transfer family protein [Chitinophaga pinensis]|uniref:TRAG family protein n=1 Tax=Chitinophaga pinensis (strain ATCC 43595 / DSM 2588 / LMG 13176 / NBRC 15968 / NCIMB 11800 / UQM 2034) TaxID=485918 RepID=A0A979GAC4_CHIPD|nr:type IV secretory system conjugative DNA transfer family protein [Chitinophaga pinensis]ACU63731.1 TRAG family protein [Chitinophaga pinensis DSM 2588]
MQNERSKGLLNISQKEVVDFFDKETDSEGVMKLFLMFVGVTLTPITLLGALIFYKKGYKRFMEGEHPRLHDLPPIVSLGMIIGAISIWGSLFFFASYMHSFFYLIFGEAVDHNSFYIYAFTGINIVLTVAVFLWFQRWRLKAAKYAADTKRHGTARFAKPEELQPYEAPKGFYIGQGTYYNKPGHLLSVAGTRGGKGVNLILQNLLMPHLFKGSWVVIDPKGELLAISKSAQLAAGRKVVVLNPWQLLGLNGVSYNPLDLLKNDWLNMADDVEMLAEAIIPADPDSENSHWSLRARTFISGLLLHLVTTAPEDERHLGTLWQWLRLENDKWIELLADMSLNNDPNAGEIVRATANEIISLMKMSDKEYGSVMSSAQKHTDFIKSPALREALKASTDFKAEDLASGNVTVYVCIPFDRLKSHNAWLRLVVISLMRSVIRNPKKDVCFLLDEAYAFGYHSEIDMALGAYAGFGIHVWSIFQTLVQIKKIYGDNWENFIANSSVRHFFNISDNFSAEYISTMFGQTSVPEYDEKGELKGATARPLVTNDELRRTSGEVIYSVIDQLSPAQIPKHPYYTMDLPADPNPYYKG